MEMKEFRGGWMTVIDYLPVGEEVGPNVLLSQTKKCSISKVMASITSLLFQELLYKHPINSRREESSQIL